jgi:hypothetical protein
MSKTRGLPEVLVQIDACRQIPSVGAMIQTLRNSLSNENHVRTPELYHAHNHRCFFRSHHRGRARGRSFREAAKLISAKVMTKPLNQMPYQTVGDLLLTFSGTTNVVNYRRTLDLDTATASVSYFNDGVRYATFQISNLKFEIDLLPALPQAWPTGSVKDLRARGAFEVDVAWRGGNMVEAGIRSLEGGSARLRYGSVTRDLTFSKGETHRWNGQ